MKRHFLFFIFLVISQTVFCNLLYDITDGRFSARGIPALHSMSDGEHYTVLINNEAIVKYNYKSGEVVDTVFNVSKLENAPVKKISGYEFSPNEELIMVYNNVQYRYRRTFTADYYIYNIKKNELKQLSEYGRQEAPLFSPDSRYVAFARDNNLFLRKLDFNTEITVTKDGEFGKIINGIPDWVYEEEFGVRRYFEWSPDSKLLAFLKFDETEVPEFSFQLYNKAPDADGITLYPDYLNFKYPKAGESNSKVKVFVYDDYNKTTREISVGGEDEDFYVPRICWTNSPEQLAVFKLNRNQNKLDMYLANPKSTVAKLVLSEEDKYYVDYELVDDIYFFKDNKSFLYVSEKDGYCHVYKYRMNGILDKQLTSGEWDVTHVYGYDEKSNVLYYQSAETSPMQRNIYALDAKGRKTMLTDGKGTHNATFNATYSYFVDNASSLEMPNKITLRTNKGAEVRVMKENSAVENDFKSLNMAEKEFFKFKTSESVELNGWILKPKNLEASKEYPLLMVQYSGPGSQQVVDRWGIGWEYYLAEMGYVVACVDGRGTGARGAEFRKCTYQQLGVLETKDQIEAAKYLGAKEYIDASRIGIWGWSFGGFMTLSTMSADESVFKVGISVAPVTDWRLYNTAYTERFMRRPQENFKGYDETSPLVKADKLNGKLLIIHGTADDNVHVQNTMLYIQRLVEADKQFEMQLYTDKNHSILGKQTRRHLYKRKCDFLFKNL
ncbi:S9 family peptidase [Paludibacter sp. 221]|uniref:S9 family peptidase n=1 Tax=Paludibacter sp. 221 TaxID=2302939 RepID=UPI0013D76505|nr:S9 family peptidase [Paludibacter sp. 221]NDV45940.1 S9 family peptidase [Paludibacter sp. 221]